MPKQNSSIRSRNRLLSRVQVAKLKNNEDQLKCVCLRLDSSTTNMGFWLCECEMSFVNAQDYVQTKLQSDLGV